MTRKKSYFVKVYVDNRLDESYKFERKDRAIEKMSQLKSLYRGQRLYQVKFEVA